MSQVIVPPKKKVNQLYHKLVIAYAAPKAKADSRVVNYYCPGCRRGSTRSMDSRDRFRAVRAYRKTDPGDVGSNAGDASDGPGLPGGAGQPRPTPVGALPAGRVYGRVGQSAPTCAMFRKSNCPGWLVGFPACGRRVLRPYSRRARHRD